MRARLWWSAYSKLLDTYPIRTKASTAFVIFGTADSVRQAIELSALPKSSSDCTCCWDPVRTARLAAFYAIVHAPAVSYWYAFLDRTIGATTSPLHVLLKVLVDQFLFMPCFMTTLFTTLPLLEGHDIHYVRRKLQRDLLPTVQGAWMCWIPAVMVSFAFVPLKFRLLYVNCIQIFFGVWVSQQVNSKVEAASPDQEEKSENDSLLSEVSTNSQQ